LLRGKRGLLFNKEDGPEPRISVLVGWEWFPKILTLLLMDVRKELINHPPGRSEKNKRSKERES